MLVIPTTAPACRMASLPAEHYSPPPWTQRKARANWEAGEDKLYNDPRVLALSAAKVRNMRSIYAALHRMRNYLTHYCDSTIAQVSAVARSCETVVKEILGLLWEYEVIVRVPRRVFDENYQPPGWQGWGVWRQASNCYEPATPEGRWPEFAPPSTDHVNPRVDQQEEAEVEFRPGDHARVFGEGAALIVDLPAVEAIAEDPEPSVENPATLCSEVGKRPLSPEVLLSTTLTTQQDKLSAGQTGKEVALERRRSCNEASLAAESEGGRKRSPLEAALERLGRSVAEGKPTRGPS